MFVKLDIPDDLYAKIKKLADEENISITEWIYIRLDVHVNGLTYEQYLQQYGSSEAILKDLGLS